MLLTLALVLGSVDYSFMAVQATEDNGTIASVTPGDTTSDGNSASDGNSGGDTGATVTTKYYTFNDVSVTSSYGNTKEVSEAGTLSISYDSQYDEVQYSLPAGVDGTTVSNITFHVAEGTANDLSVKVYVDGSQKQVAYHGGAISVTEDLSTATTVTFGLMNNGSEAADFVIDYFTITAVQTGGSDSVPTPEPEATEAPSADPNAYTFENLTVNTSYGNTRIVNADGSLSITFDSQYMEAKYALPSGVTAANITKMSLDVAEGAELVDFKIYTSTDGSTWTEATTKYGKYGSFDVVMEDAGIDASTIVSFGIMADAAGSALINSVIIEQSAAEATPTPVPEVTATPEPEATATPVPEATETPVPTTTTKYYTFNDVTYSGGYGIEYEIDETTGALDLAFVESEYGYQPIGFTFPEGIDTTTITNITFHNTSGDIWKLGIKIFATDEIPSNWSATAQNWDGKGAMNITTEQAKDGLNFFGLVHGSSSGEAYDGLVLDYFSITTTGEQTGGLEEPPVATATPTPIPEATATPEPEATATPSPVAATTKYYTFNDVSVTTSYGNTKEVSEAGALSISYTGQYQEVQYSLPAGVDGTTVSNITFHVAEGTANDLAVKVYVDGSEAQVAYHGGAISVTADLSTASTVTLGLMNNASAAAEFVIDYFTITAVQTGGSDSAPEAAPEATPAPETATTKYYTFNDVSATGGYGHSKEVSESGTLSISYDSQYSEVKYSLPAGVDGTTVSNITFHVAEGTANDLAVKVYVDGSEAQVAYHGGAISVTADLSSASTVTFGLMNNSSDAADFVIDYFTITAVQTGGSDSAPSTGDDATPTPTPEVTPAPTTYTKYYTFNDVEMGQGYGATTSISEAGELSLSYSADNSYPIISFTFPEGVDTSTIESMNFHINGETNYKLAVKLFAEEIDSSWDNKVQVNWGVTGTVKMTDAKGENLKYFAFMNAQDKVALEGLTIDYFTITTTTEQTGGSDTAPGAEPEEPIDTSKNITPAAESDEDYSWTGNDLGEVYNTTASATLDAETSRWNLTFNGAWQEIRFALPEEIDVSMVDTMTIAISAQSAPLCFKVYTADGEVADWTKYTQTDKNLYELNFIGITGNIVSVAIMLHSDDLNNATETCSFDGVMFDMLKEEEVVETYEVNVGANELVFSGSQGSETSTLAGNAHSITFGALNDEVRYTLPEMVNLAKCQTITVKVANQNGPVNFFVGSGASKYESYWYNVGKDEYVLVPTISSKIDTIGIQCGGEEYTANAALELVSITFTMEGTEPLPTPEDGIYTYAHFEEVVLSEGATVLLNAANKVAAIAFANAGDSVTLTVPDSVDLNHLVTVNYVGTGAENISIVLLDKDGNEINATTASSIEAKCNPDIKYIKLVSNAANTTLDMSGIKFNVDPNAFEAIVLNGNFAREDTSMWGAALWGSVDDVPTEIISRVSDTPIYDDVYTYGEVTRRSSPYVCFAQDITDRIEPGHNYSYSFYAKMSDDYEGAADILSQIEFSPYYVDNNGGTHYSMKLMGVTKTYVTNDGWVYFSGYVHVPYEAATVVIRIVEQGTNYGQGQCLLGSYYITGVQMQETGTVYWPNNSYGGGGNAANTTITKEANWIGTYDMDDLLVEWASADYDVNNDDTLDITFDNNYDEVRMDLPRELDMSTAAYVKVKTSGQTVPIAVKLYYKGSQVDVGYYNTISNEYTLVPTYTGMIDAIGIMSLATPNPADAAVTFESITFGLTQEPAPLPPRTSIVLNGDFASDDLADWKASFWGDGVTMTRKTSSTPIADGVYNYASYSKRTSPYQCFAQDITDAVVEGETYTFSFWARLSSAYEGAPESQRIIQFAPYTVDSEGNADYNPRLDGTYLQVCEPGVWTYFEGTYKVTNPNDVAKVVIRILEQGTNYGQGECVLGGYDVADVKMAVYVPEPPSIDEDVPNLKDALAEDFGDDFMTGTAVTLNEIEDIGIEMLVNKHFNAVTIGNELKPDALFNYSNSQHTELQTVTFNGQELVVPTLHYARAEEVLDKLLEWNEAHPETPIKVKGHVLVWHSQTPEWFFRENYEVGTNADGTPNYVSAEEMNLRLEWYISTVLNHFLGEDSPYKDMFYAWDVVNEAVSNGASGYRTDKASSVEDPNADTHGSNSSWWAVYQSNEFIINAFKYANMYAPADIELYYNDYNECDSGKMKGIVQLLTDVKNAEGTRIDGMGMQGHYNMFNPSASAIETAIRAYAAVVGKVNYSELDMKVSGDISNDEKLQKEYLAQAERYHDIYQVLLKLDAEEDIEISGITWWGTVDHYSWLQDSSDVGGGSDGSLTQCPLLFDTSYKVKPSYWAFVDYSMVDPDWAPEEEKEVVDEKTEEKIEEPAVEEDKTTEETKPEGSKPVEDTTSTPAEEEEGSVLPFAIGGGVGVAGIAAVVAAILRKKKLAKVPTGE